MKFSATNSLTVTRVSIHMQKAGKLTIEICNHEKKKDEDITSTVNNVNNDKSSLQKFRQKVTFHLLNL